MNNYHYISISTYIWFSFELCTFNDVPLIEIDNYDITGTDWYWLFGCDINMETGEGGYISSPSALYAGVT